MTLQHSNSKDRGGPRYLWDLFKVREEAAKECLLKKMSACLSDTYHVQEEKAYSLLRNVLSNWKHTTGHKSHYKEICIEGAICLLELGSIWQFSDERQHAAIQAEVHSCVPSTCYTMGV